jgi:hypothetical protein
MSSLFYKLVSGFYTSVTCIFMSRCKYHLTTFGMSLHVQNAG